MEDAAQAVTGEKITLHSAGRTDTGVHAIAMRSHLDVEKAYAVSHGGGDQRQAAPAPVAVTRCEVVPDDWHARFCCIGRSYEYRIINRRASLTLEKERAWHVAPERDA